MKLLIDIGHPAHVHYFRNMAYIFMQKGAKVLFTTRDKEVSIQLLEYYHLPYINFGKPFKSRIGKIWGLFWFTLRLFIVALKFKPDIYLNATQYSAMVAWLMRKPHVSIEDTFNFEQVRLYMPFTSVVLTGSYSHPDLGKKEVRYAGYQELAYLHPKRFTPEPCSQKIIDLRGNEKYVILRFVSWQATHDFGHPGISIANKLKMLEQFSKYARVYISSEARDLGELEKYRLKIRPEKVHDFLSNCTLLLGESYTMASECAVLGVPAIIIHNTRSFYLQEQEQRYGLVFNFSESPEDQDKAIEKAIELFRMPDIKEEWQKRRRRMLEDMIDPTAFWGWFIENYPESHQIMKSNPEYQLRFK